MTGAADIWPRPLFPLDAATLRECQVFCVCVIRPMLHQKEACMTISKGYPERAAASSRIRDRSRSRNEMAPSPFRFAGDFWGREALFNWPQLRNETKWAFLAGSLRTRRT